MAKPTKKEIRRSRDSGRQPREVALFGAGLAVGITAGAGIGAVTGDIGLGVALGAGIGAALGSLFVGARLELPERDG